ncbi:MAG: alpha/beta hydrolase [Chloroflexi bacterium]|nr:alpha/beta hydrolase [Chloroflexota bacterium]
MSGHSSKKVLRFSVVFFVASVVFVTGFFTLSAATLATDSGAILRNSAPDHGTAVAQSWGEPVTGMTATYAIYKKDFIYGTTPLTITDIRADVDNKIYSNKEGYEIRGLTVYRAFDGQQLLDRQPVVFFVHGGAWIDGYRDWYQFVARSFTGEKGWVTVVIDYRLTSNQVFLADQYCPNRITCTLPENEPYRTKAAWYPNNITDVADALQWVIYNIAANGGDADRIVVFGHSAGGHLVSLLATHTDYATTLRPAIKGLITMSGAYDLNGLNHIFWNSAITQTFQGGFDNSALLTQASPATYVVSDTALPPFYILYAEDDLLNLTDQNIGFKTRLESLGFDVTSSYLAGYGHETEMAAIADINETPTTLIVNWIEGVLQEKVFLPAVLAHSGR